MMCSLLAALPGCATRYPQGTLAGLGARRIVLLEPRHETRLKLEISPWALPISAASLRTEQMEVNTALGPWEDKVVRGFSAALQAELRQGGVDVEWVPRDAQSTTPRAPDPLVRSHLTAGFVYKTFTSSTYMPFVAVVLELEARSGAVSYHQLYVATNRPFNPLMTNLPATTAYAFAGIESLGTEAASALDALTSLATQLARKFASDLLA